MATGATIANRKMRILCEVNLLAIALLVLLLGKISLLYINLH